jgi:hypothetical protein
MRSFRLFAACALATCGLASLLLADDEAQREAEVTAFSEALADDVINERPLVVSAAAGTSRCSHCQGNDDATAGATFCPTACANEKSGKTDAPMSIAAREILKLRRAVGKNPVAGTIFESQTATDEASATDADSDEQTIAAAVHQFECHTAAQPQATTDLQNPPVEYRPGAERMLRPAERHLEEAAAILEQAGQYDRADAARDLAARIRQDARRCEMLWYSNQTPVPPSSGPADR